MKKRIITVAFGDLYYFPLFRSYMEDYAKRVGAEFEILGGGSHELHPKIGMLREIVRWAAECEPDDRLLYVDADILIRQGAPDIFELEGTSGSVWACQGFLPDVRVAWKSWMARHYDIEADPERYVNAGVLLFDGVAAKRAAPFLHQPFIEGCMDQHQVNAAILLAKANLIHIPCCWNAKASWLLERLSGGVNFVHFVGQGMTQRPIIEFTMRILANRGFEAAEASNHDREIQAVHVDNSINAPAG